MNKEKDLEEENNKLSFALQQLKLNTKDDGEFIAEKIKNFIDLETLELRGNTLGVDATLPIAEALKDRQELKHALWSDLFTGRLKAEIPETLKLLTSAIMYSGARLVELDLSDNAIGPMAMPGLEDFLASESASDLKILNLNNCGLGIAGKTIGECLIECYTNSLELGKPLALEKFVAGRNRLELISTKELSKAFKQIGTLIEIIMPQNGIKAEGIISLAEAVKYNKNLKVLNLNDNTFCEEGALAMADALSHLKNLETVDFGDCLCRNVGSVRICNQLLKSGSPLVNLILSGNEIGYSSAKHIIDRIKKIKTIKQLNLSLNCFGSNFEDLKQDEDFFKFLDMGIKSDDEGTIDNEPESNSD